jgi:tripartite ATP-independent transporter DctP family solute receptor
MMSMDRRKFIQRSLGTGALAVAAPYVARGAEPIILKLGHPDTALHPSHALGNQLGKMIQERTGGAVTVRVFPGGQLGSNTNIVTGLATGIVDLCIHTTGGASSVYTPLQVLDLPFLFRDAATAERVLDGPIGQDLLNGMTATGIYGLSWGTHGWRITETTNKVVREPADLAGLKIRIQPSPVFNAMFKAIGAVPIVMDITELYLALSQNTVQGMEVPFMAVASSKLYEVTKQAGLTNHVYNSSLLMASKVKLDSLDAKHQEVIRQVGKEIGPVWRKMVIEKTAEARKICEDKGMTVSETNYPAFRKVVQPVYDEFRTTIGAELVDKVVKAAS